VSRRTERVASLIRSILAEAIQNRLSDPRIEPLTSITRVEVSADLSVAHVYVSVMAEAPRRKLSVSALRCAAGRLRSVVAQEVTLRQTPQLDFRLDDSVQRSFETVQQLDRIMQELDEPAGHAAEPRAESDLHSTPADADAAGRDNDAAAGERATAGVRPTDPERRRRDGAAGDTHKGQEDT
jgi:ribosome-binding factor A